MAKRCTHPRPRVHEEVSAESVWEFQGGEIVNDYSRNSGPTGMYFVFCPDCGLGRRLRDTADMPEWIRALIDRVKVRT